MSGADAAAGPGAASGAFITFEGVDGAGKSTQLRRLADGLRAEGREVVTTREPGGSPGAEEIRALLVTGAPERWSPETELLLFNAARRDHWERVIAPALARGAVVLCDRFVDSTRAYQSAGRGAPVELVEALHGLTIGREADATVLLDLDPSVSLARAQARAEPPAAPDAPSPAAAATETRFERFGQEFQDRLRAAFLAIAARDPARLRVIDAAGAPGLVAAKVRRALSPPLGPAP